MSGGIPSPLRSADSARRPPPPNHFVPGVLSKASVEPACPRDDTSARPQCPERNRPLDARPVLLPPPPLTRPPKAHTIDCMQSHMTSRDGRGREPMARRSRAVVRRRPGRRSRIGAGRLAPVPGGLALAGLLWALSAVFAALALAQPPRMETPRPLEGALLRRWPCGCKPGRSQRVYEKLFLEAIRKAPEGRPRVARGVSPWRADGAAAEPFSAPQSRPRPQGLTPLATRGRPSGAENHLSGSPLRKRLGWAQARPRVFVDETRPSKSFPDVPWDGSTLGLFGLLRFLGVRRLGGNGLATAAPLVRRPVVGRSCVKSCFWESVKTPSHSVSS